MNPQQDAVKLLITYDPIPERWEAYFRYMLGEFVPALEHLGLTMCEAWHTAYGEYPLRLSAFTAPDEISMEQVLASEAFRELEDRLKEFVTNYQRKIVPVRERFQF
jgi:hypothetical protein